MLHPCGFAVAPVGSIDARTACPTVGSASGHSHSQKGCVLCCGWVPRVQTMDVLEVIAKKENLTLPKQMAAKIAANSKGNMRRAILMLETAKVQRFALLCACLHV